MCPEAHSEPTVLLAARLFSDIPGCFHLGVMLCKEVRVPLLSVHCAIL